MSVQNWFYDLFDFVLCTSWADFQLCENVRFTVPLNRCVGELKKNMNPSEVRIDEIKLERIYVVWNERGPVYPWWEITCLLASTRFHVIFTSVGYLNLSVLQGKLSLPACLSTGDTQEACSHANKYPLIFHPVGAICFSLLFQAVLGE